MIIEFFEVVPSFIEILHTTAFWSLALKTLMGSVGLWIILGIPFWAFLLTAMTVYNGTGSEQAAATGGLVAMPTSHLLTWIVVATII